MAATYQKAGVDIDSGDALVERIKPFAKATRRAGSMDDLGGFGALFDTKAAGYKDPLLVSSTDGVGTKLKIAQAMNRHDTIGIDLVAMCVNDLVVQGAEPLFFLDYFATGKLSVEVAEMVIKGIAEGCKEAGCALVGGETAEMPGMYGEGEYDLAGFAVGAVERGETLPAKNIGEGDMVLGLAASGVHSNGFSLVRYILAQKGLDYGDPAPFDSSQRVGDAFLIPTKLYVKNCLAARRTHPGAIKAFAHITGGGLPENLPRVLPKTVSARIDTRAWEMPAVFRWLQEAGQVPTADIRRTFNCGIGMAVVVDTAKADAVAATFEAGGETVYRLGQLMTRQDKAVVFV